MTAFKLMEIRIAQAVTFLRIFPFSRICGIPCSSRKYDVQSQLFVVLQKTIICFPFCFKSREIIFSSNSKELLETNFSFFNYLKTSDIIMNFVPTTFLMLCNFNKFLRDMRENLM